MEGLLVIGSLLGVALVATGWRFVHQLKRRRLVSGLFWSLQGGTVLCGFLLVLLVYSNLHTYQRLTYEQVIADVYVRRLAPQRFQVSLVQGDDKTDPSYYELVGDHWLIDARILKWKGWANLIGLDSFYQLERLSGRFADINQARNRLPSLHDLSNPSTGLDIWKMKRMLRDKINFVDTLFGQGVYMPMADGAHYRVSIGQSGLITRPVNEAARAATL